MKAGVEFNILSYNLVDSVKNNENADFLTLRNENGNTEFIRVYTQFQYNATEKLQINAGLHYQELLLNNTYNIEPRVGLSYKINEKNSVSAAYGAHSYMNSLMFYFSQSQQVDGTYIKPNIELDFIHADHYVLSYDRRLGKNSRLKTELYFQNLSNAPVNGHESSSFSLLNAGSAYFANIPDTMVSEGTGINYGAEITYERFLNEGLYYLFTVSIFDSKYKGSDGIDRNTAFNSNYISNLLMGKEFTFNSKKGSLNYLSLNIKATYAGGQRYTPFDIDASMAQNKVIYNHSQEYALQNDPYFRSDFKIAFRKNKGRITMEYALDIQNIFGNKNIFNRSIEPETGEISYLYQMGRLIIPQFRIEF